MKQTPHINGVKSKYMNIRITPTMLDALKKEAEENTRTVAAQVLHILKQYLEKKS